MVKSLKFVKLIYQIIADEHSIIVIEDETEAKKYVEEQLKGAQILVLPISVFRYCEVPVK